MNVPDFPTALAALGVLLYSIPAYRVIMAIFDSHGHIEKARKARLIKKDPKLERKELGYARDAITIGNLVTPNGARLLLAGLCMQAIAAAAFVTKYLVSLN